MNHLSEIKLLLINLTIVGISFTDIEVILKITLLGLSIIYTAYKLFKEVKKQ
jgi:hypothetical protein